MASLFPPWADSLLGAAAAALVLAGAGLPLFLMLWVRTPYATARLRPVDQPVMFDHRHHVGDDGIDCRFCHAGAEVSAHAGLPSTETCMGCHDQIWSDAPFLAPVRQSLAQNTPIAWRRVTRLPDFVYFDHSVHVRNGVGCERCHGNVEQMGEVYAVLPVRMAWCLDCHRDPGPGLRQLHPPTNCSACHR